MEWMLLPFRRYADFSGRSRRKEYWMFALLYLIVTLICVGIMFSGGAFSAFEQVAEAGAAPEAPGVLFWIGMTILMVFLLASIIPSLAVTVRRFHDQDKSGWFVLLNFVPYIGGLILLVFMCMEGTRGPNRFGDDPKDPTGGANVFA